VSKLLQVENLSTTFYTEDGMVPAVRGVSFHLDYGESLGIVGESGCGKSVSCLSVMRLIPKPGEMTADNIDFEGKDIVSLRERQMQQIRGNDMAMIFQEPMTSFNPVFTIGYQLQEAIRLHQKMNKHDAKEKSIDMLRQVGIPRPEKVVDNYPHSLSGGMRQRAMIAMAISCQPKIIFADEPTTALDVTIQAQILELIGELKEQTNTSVVFISHDLGVIAEMVERVIVMYSGIIVEQSDISSLFSNPKHPYTIGLLHSKPRIDDERAKLKPIPGSVPNPLDLPQGCPYNPRCEYVMDICRNKLPDMYEIDKNLHQARCWLYA